jgi:hypothetical protein
VYSSSMVARGVGGRRIKMREEDVRCLGEIMTVGERGMNTLAMAVVRRVNIRLIGLDVICCSGGYYGCICFLFGKKTTIVS